MAARASHFAAAARKVSRSAARIQPWLRPGNPAVRLTSTTSAAPAAEASKPAADGAKPAQNAPKPDAQSSPGGEGAWARVGQAVAAVTLFGSAAAGAYAVFEARQQRENTKEALAEMKSATAEVKVVAATEQQKAEKNLDKHVSDAKEAIRLQREALQVQQQALEESLKAQHKTLEESVKTHTWYATWGPAASTALAFGVAYAGAGLINRGK